MPPKQDSHLAMLENVVYNFLKNDEEKVRREFLYSYSFANGTALEVDRKVELAAPHARSKKLHWHTWRGRGDWGPVCQKHCHVYFGKWMEIGMFMVQRWFLSLCHEQWMDSFLFVSNGFLWWPHFLTSKNLNPQLVRSSLLSQFRLKHSHSLLLLTKSNWRCSPLMFISKITERSDANNAHWGHQSVHTWDTTRIMALEAFYSNRWRR